LKIRNYRIKPLFAESQRDYSPKLREN